MTGKRRKQNASSDKEEQRQGQSGKGKSEKGQLRDRK
jgi:hypothetical protein